MITRLKVQGYKALRDLEVSFGQLSVLVGPNGCGKSSVLGAITLLRDLALGKSGGNPGPPMPRGIASRDPEGGRENSPISVSMRRELRSRVLHVEGSFESHEEFPQYLDAERSSLKVWFAGGEVAVVHKNWARSTPELEESVEDILQYRFDSNAMSQPVYSEVARPRLAPSGENLAVVLDALQGEHRERFESIESDLCRFIPGLRRVRLHRVEMPVWRRVLVGNQYQQVQDNSVGHQVVLDFDFAKSVAADQASEGTLLLLGLLTAIGVEPDKPATVMLDDLDRALHPKAQRQLIEHLHALLGQRPQLQIIATSHSPYLVEHLAYEEVLAMTQAREDGRSLIAPLAQHPEAEKWRDEMSAGEFWSSMGEDWIAQGRAASE